MSSPQDAIASIVEEYSSLTIASYCSTAAAVVVLYDHLLTLGDEVTSFWSDKLRAAHALFFLNRLGVVYFMLTFSANAVHCAAAARTSKAVGLVLFFPWAAFAGLRAYALSRKWMVAVFIFLLSITPMCMNAVAFKFGVTGVNVPGMGCAGADSIPPLLARRFTVASRTCLIVADCILIYLTWSHLPTQHKHRVFRRRTSLVDVLLRDGTIYFVVLLILNVLHLAFTLMATNAVTFQNTSFIPIFTQPLTTNLVSRFLLDLQAADRAVRDQVSTLSGSTLSHTSTVVFQRQTVDSVACSIPLDDLHSENGRNPDSTDLSSSWETRY